MALLPLVGAPASATRIESGETAPAARPEVARRVGRPTVLVVDNDPALSREVAAALGPEVRVVGAPDAYQALEHVRSGPVDLVVLEVFLPGADGQEVLRRLRMRPEAPPVVVVTHARSAVATGAALGVAAVLSKPAGPSLLREALRAALGHGESAAEGPSRAGDPRRSRGAAEEHPATAVIRRESREPAEVCVAAPHAPRRASRPERVHRRAR